MEKTGKRVRLSYEQQRKIAKEFVNQIEDRRFDSTDVVSFMERTFAWYATLTTAKKNSRALDIIKVMEKEYGEAFQKLSNSGGGSYAKYIISDEKVEIVVSTTESIKAEKLYQVLREALKSPELGISKTNVARLMGYKSEQVSASMLESINNEIERICGEGFRPLEINRDHVFTDYDVVKARVEEANMVLEDLLEKMGREEPAEVEIDPTYHNEVKAIIKKDYNLAMMFKTPSGKVLFKGGDGHKLMREIAGCVSIGADLAAEKYQNTLNKRYGIEDEYFVGISRRGFEVLSKELLNKALIAIEDKYVEFFCEEIVPHEKSILEETRKSSAEIDEEAVLRVIETEVFNNKSGEMFLRDLWKHLDRIGIKRGWNLKGLLMANSDRFQIKGKNVAGYLEDYVCYTAPVLIPEEPEEPNNEEKVVDSYYHEDDDLIPEVQQDSKFKYEVYFGFKIEEDMLELCKNLKYRPIDKDGEYFMCMIDVAEGINTSTKREVISLLRLCYMSQANGSVKMIHYDKDFLIQCLENTLIG